MRRTLLGCLLVLLLWPGLGRGAELVSDNFNRADGGLGTNWTTITAKLAPAIVANAVQRNTTATPSSQALYTGIAWPNNQQASITVTTLTSGSIGPIVRGTAATTTDYVAQVNAPCDGTSTLQVSRVVNNTATVIYGPTTKTCTAGQVVKLVVSGGTPSTLTVYYNGVDQTGPITDNTPILSGSAGIFVTTAGAATTAVLDNFLGESIAGSGHMLLRMGQ